MMGDTFTPSPSHPLTLSPPHLSQPSHPVKRTKPFPFHILVFLLPATLIYTVFMTYPLADSIRLSFFASNASGQESFVGLQNYVTLLTNDLYSPRFWSALVHNFVFFLGRTYFTKTFEPERRRPEFGTMSLSWYF